MVEPEKSELNPLTSSPILAEEEGLIIWLAGMHDLEPADLRRASMAYNRLYRLYERLRINFENQNSYSFPIGRNHEGIIKMKMLTQENYVKENNMKPVSALNFMANIILKRSPKGEITESSNLDSFTIAKKGGVDASFSKGVYIAGSIAEHGTYSYPYPLLYVPQLSEPLVDWVFKLRRERRYSSPPTFSFQDPNDFPA